MSRRKLLLIAYHFPPIQGSTGTTRTVAFARYLQELGWQVHILTISPSAYEQTSSQNANLVPTGVTVHRCWGLDASHKVSVFGRYPLLLAIPDRWQSWIAGAYVGGSKVIKSIRPDVIMTTYPIPSAHVIGYLLRKKFKIPWVAEFRDPMLQEDYPGTKLERWAYAKTEKAVFSAANEVIVTTDRCKETYERRYSEFLPFRLSTISNGYDPEIFNQTRPVDEPSSATQFVFLHSGLLYPYERNPDKFFRAVCRIAADGILNSVSVEFRFRASGNEESYIKQVRELGIEKYITFLPDITYIKALEEMQSVDALMIFQAGNCSEQIPAKIYEYFFCRKPILGLSAPSSATGQLLESAGVPYVASLESSSEIQSATVRLLRDLQDSKEFIVPDRIVSRYSRRTLTGDLDKVLRRAITQ